MLSDVYTLTATLAVYTMAEMAEPTPTGPGAAMTDNEGESITDNAGDPIVSNP